MVLMELPVQKFVAELASTSPAPGGGTIAAVNGAFAAGLGSMVCGLTIGNAKYPDAQSILPTARALLEGLHQKFLALADEDTEAFNKVMAAFKLPKETDAEKALRREAIRAANAEATRVPLKTAGYAVDTAEALIQVTRYGNTNAASDCGVAIECARTAAQGAFMNISINLPSVKEETLAREFAEKKAELMKKAEYFYNRSMDELRAKLSV